MIGMALRQDDEGERPRAVRRQQPLRPLGIVHEAGVDHHVAFARGYEVSIRDVVGLKDEAGDGDGIGLLVARAHEAGQLRAGILCFGHGQSSIPIMTLADCGVAAISSPFITSAKGSLWLIMAAILSFRRGMAAITSGISVG